MTKKSTPPKHGGLRMPPAYEAVLGQDRVCDVCGETKPISPSTFSPKKGLPNDCHTTCKSCVMKASGARRRAARAAKYGAPVKPKTKGFTADPVRNLDAFYDEVDAKMAELIRLSQMKRPPQADIKALVTDLTAVTRLKDDPAGGGKATDERLAFKVFMRCLRPAIAAYNELGDIHEDILDALLCQDPNVVLLASRGSAKSTITAQYATWLLWRDPEQETVLVVSRSEVHAKKLLKAIKSFIVTVPLLAELLPDEEQLDSAFNLEVGPAKGKLGMSTSVTCRGLTGQITGLRARTIIGDDVESPRDDTPEAVDRLQEAIAEFQHVAVPGATVTLLGTPQSPFSLYGRLGRSEAWTVFTACLFREYEDADSKTRFESRWPSRFDEDEFQRRKKSVSKRAFALHYKLDLSETMDNEQPFKLAALPVLDWPSKARQVPFEIKGGEDGEIVKNVPRGRAEDGDEWRLATEVSSDTGMWTQVVAAVDPASGLRGGKHDAIGLAIVGITQGGRGVIRAAQGVRGDTTEDAIQHTALLIAEYGSNTLLVEETAGSLFGRMLVAQLATMNYPMSYEAVTTGGVRKARRIVEAISPALASGKLSICMDVLTHEDASEMVDQYTGMTYDARKLKHDDIIDAVSYAVGACAPALSADETDFTAGARFTIDELMAMPKRRCLLSEEELEAFMFESEEEANYKLKLQRALDDQRKLLARGLDTTRIDKYVVKLNEALTAMRATRRRFVLPSPDQPTPKSPASMAALRRRGVPVDVEY